MTISCALPFGAIPFQSTSFIRRMTWYKLAVVCIGVFQSTSFIRRMTQLDNAPDFIKIISIHILHTKDDILRSSFLFLLRHFNPHPSYEGWRIVPYSALNGIDFNPHPSYEGWPHAHHILHGALKFQSTSFIRRMTGNMWLIMTGWRLFQSTSFIRRMTLVVGVAALWAGFQSTSFIRRMTVITAANQIRYIFQRCNNYHFNPHPSYEGWPVFYLPLREWWDFNPHPSYEGWRTAQLHVQSRRDFNPHPSYEGWLIISPWGGF